jgi:hypothetical protein
MDTCLLTHLSHLRKTSAPFAYIDIELKTIFDVWKGARVRALGAAGKGRQTRGGWRYLRKRNQYSNVCVFFPRLSQSIVCLFERGVGGATRFPKSWICTLTHILANVIFNYSDLEKGAWLTHLCAHKYTHTRYGSCWLSACTQVLAGHKAQQ